MEPKDAEVLIVGAGPTGLQLAYLLAIQNIPFHLIDKKKGATTHSKALGVQARTREMWDRLGIGAEHLKKANPLQKIGLYENGKLIAENPFYIPDTEYPYVSAFPQAETEQMLIDHLNQFKKEIMWETEFLGLEQKAGGVCAEMRLPCGYVARKNYAWVVGCDGGKSQVRKSAAIAFSGHRAEQKFLLADLFFTKSLPEDRGLIHWSAEGETLLFPMQNGLTRIIVEDGGSEELSAEEWSELIAERLPFPLEIREIVWQSRFHVRFMRAQEIVKERVILAGDASHVHSPVMGQGMNTGLQDVYNLGWKLACAIQNEASSLLIRSYRDEREKIAKDLLKMTEVATNVVTMKGSMGSFLRKNLFALAFSNRVTGRAAARKMAQLSLHYRGSPICVEHIKSNISSKSLSFRFGPAPGDRAPNGAAVQKNKPQVQTLYHYLRGYTHVALFFMAEGSENEVDALFRLHLFLQNHLESRVRQALVITDEKAASLEGWHGDVLFDFDKTLHGSYACKEPALYIIRPDGYIGYRSNTLAKQGVEKYLKRVFDNTV